MTPQSVTTSTRRDRGRDLAGRGVAVILVAIATVALDRGVAGVLLGVTGAFAPLSWPSLVGVATLAGVCGFVVFTTLTWFTSRPRRWFATIATGVVVASFVPLAVVGPTVPGATTELLVVLAAMHVASPSESRDRCSDDRAPLTEVETTSSRG